LAIVIFVFYHCNWTVTWRIVAGHFALWNERDSFVNMWYLCWPFCAM